MTDYNNQNEIQNSNQSPNQDGKYHGFAIAAMVCGIVGIVFFCVWYISIILDILAIVFGTLVLKHNKKTNTNTGRGMAIAGLVLGIVSIALVIVLIAGLFATVSSLDKYRSWY